MAVNKMLAEGLEYHLPFHTPEGNPGMFHVHKDDMLQWLERFDTPEQIGIKPHPFGLTGGVDAI
jgi:hypothetical protein